VRTKCFVFSLSILLSVIPNHRNQPTAQSSIPAAKGEVLSVTAAMRMFYGNYNPESQTSMFNLPDGPVTNVLLVKNEPMLATSFFNTSTDESGSHKFVLLTFAVPKGREFSCHACAPVIGMAVFARVGHGWAIESSNKAITTSGGYAQPPIGISVVRIGRDHSAIEIKDSGSGSGETTTAFLIFAPWKGTVNLAVERIIADNDAGGCGDVACYAYHRTVEFLHKSSAGYYDLRLTLKGTDLGDPSSRSRRVHGVEVLRFEAGKYIQISRKGDLTNVDKSVAMREGLK
jgi:hypothetical protein